MRSNRLSILILCLFLLTACMNTQSCAATRYHWIETMITCPKADKNHYPKLNANVIALFNKTVEADKAIPKTMPQEQIVKLYQQAANLGHWLAMHNLAVSYYQGNGIEESEEQALYWFKEIEKLDIHEGYADMALVYRKGIGVAIDPEKSRDYMMKAAQMGDADSQFYLGHDLYDEQQQNRLYQGYALKLWQCAAEQGHKQAHFFLAIHYKVVDQLPTAFRYYLSGAKAGDGACLRALSYAYGHLGNEPTFNLQKDEVRSACLYKLNERLRNDPDLTFPNLDELCPGTVPQPNEMK